MPVCSATPRGFADTHLPWYPPIQNNPCGVPALATVGGNSVAAENLCLAHWAAKHGLKDLVAPLTFQPAAALVTTVAPSGGGIAGGTVVTITGSYLTGATGVTFGGVAGTAFVVNSDSSITVTAPAHAAGAVDVVVLSPNGNGTKTGAFTYS